MRLSPIRVLLLACMALAIAGLLAWPKQLIPGNAPASAQAQSKGNQAVEAARAVLNQAVAWEKLNPTKEAALSADAALQQYNMAVATRIGEIQARLKELADAAEKSGKTNAIITETVALETELAELQSPASPTPVVTPETEPNNTSATANTINVSASAQPCAIVSGAINPGGDLDFFTFTGAPAGSRIWIETDTGGTQNAGATSRDTVIDLLAADGTTVIENDDDDGTGNGGDGTVETGLASMIGGRTLTAGGTYFIKVRAFSGTGIVNPYRLFVVLTNVAGTAEVEANNTSATANTIVTAGSPVGLRTGAIGAAGDVDYYSVVATAGNSVYFNVDADPERDGTGTDLVVEFRDPSDVLLLSVDSSITGSLADPAAEGANFTIVTSGTYFVRVRHFSATGTGTYHIMVTACASPTPVCTPNTTVTEGDLNPGGIITFGVTSGPGSVTIDHVNAGIGTTSITVVGVPVNAVVSIPAFTPGTFAPVVVTFTPINPALAVDFTLRAAGGFMVGLPTAAFIRVRCGVAACTSISCPANITQPNDTNQCGAVVTYPAPTPNGSCGTITCSPASGSFFPVGTTTVTCTSSAGPTCTFTVTVQDTQPPSITCPANIVRSNDTNQCGAVVTYPAPTITDNCPGTFTSTCNPPSGSFFPVGTTTVNCAVNGTAAPSPSSPQPEATCGSTQTITESSSQAITPLNSVSCNNSVGHTDNSYYRAFTLSSFGINTAFNIVSVDIGVEEATSGGGASQAAKPSISKSKNGNGKVAAPNGVGGQPLTVNLYTSSMPFPTGFPGSLTLIGTASISVADQSGTILNIPVMGTAAAGSQLVVEVFTPNGQAAGNFFFIGSNAAAETGPSYLRAVACGVTTPTTTAAIGFPTMRIVMNVNGCAQQVASGPTCSFTVRVNDTQPPVITCPANITVVTATVNDPCTVVNYTTTASDNCPGVTVVCNPPSGSCFPVGVTTVTCTATDASGNPAPCSFTVSVFNGRLQDDFEACNNVVLFNTISGAYRWCCRGTIFTGVAKVTKSGNTFKLEHNAVDRRVLINLSAGSFPPSGNASLQSPPGTIRCVIQDRDTRNDTCICGAAPPPSQ